MQVVKRTDWVFKKGGVPATEVAALVDCAVEDDNHPLTLWAKKVYMITGGLRMKKQYLEQGSPEWLKWREDAITATAASATVGGQYTPKNPKYKGASTASELWGEKVALKDGKRVADQPENAAMKWGKDNEKEARRRYESLFGWSVPDVCVIHDNHDFVRASLDGLRGDDNLVVEIKCCGAPNHAKLLALQEIEDPIQRQIQFCRDFNYYRYQVLYQLLITGAERCHFVGFNPKDFAGHEQLAVVEIFPEPDEQDRLLSRVVEFWNFVETRTPPPADWCRPCWKPPTRLQLPKPAFVEEQARAKEKAESADYSLTP